MAPGASADPPASPAFAWPVRVYWEDTDAGGVVYYANYLRFFERARSEWLRSLGVDQQALLQETGCMFVVSEVHARYLHSARLGDELFVTATLHERGRARLTLHQQVLCPARTASALCEATIRLGWVDRDGRPTRIPTPLLHSLP
ncbi:tol-pal system-associated acyl-CoA thioesterase [Candidatus Symbiobacter mobilis]|uniref:Thioesterase-like protein n=1 Tax=Candidatus Symbiobacter mobilis CR TaxID=946483 RepID=U5N7V3_9BURK|nr:tol-pal system-associated acyl-CoA thioesterase [Candidatus Symbiobacter mobilis]AGX87472.1 thioesterase-like protein [Candidatus Symbiobacter mobilis CR]